MTTSNFYRFYRATSYTFSPLSFHPRYFIGTFCARNFSQSTVVHHSVSVSSSNSRKYNEGPVFHVIFSSESAESVHLNMAVFPQDAGDSHN